MDSVVGLSLKVFQSPLENICLKLLGDKAFPHDTTELTYSTSQDCDEFSHSAVQLATLRYVEETQSTNDLRSLILRNESEVKSESWIDYQIASIFAFKNSANTSLRAL